MIEPNQKKGLAVVTLVYWILLLYIIAALVWWFINLNRQNDAMAILSSSQINADEPQFVQKNEQIDDIHRRKIAQYVSEGITFLIVILVGAVYVFRATRRQLRLGQQQQNFMMAITHELKTPIAVAKLNLETLQKRKLDENQTERMLGNTLQETNRLNDLCDNILLAARLENEKRLDQRHQTNITKIAEESVMQFQRRFPTREILFENNGNTFMQGDPFMLQILVNNLMENALKYSPKDKPVLASVKKIGPKICLQIADEGAGIPNAEIKNIWGKFYRIGNEQTRSSKGTGLGLYLCKRIVQAHGGSIVVSENKPNGSIFTVKF